jgi:hypothetical protein
MINDLIAGGALEWRPAESPSSSAAPSACSWDGAGGQLSPEELAERRRQAGPRTVTAVTRS